MDALLDVAAIPGPGDVEELAAQRYRRLVFCCLVILQGEFHSQIHGLLGTWKLDLRQRTICVD